MIYLIVYIFFRYDNFDYWSRAPENLVFVETSYLYINNFYFVYFFNWSVYVHAL